MKKCDVQGWRKLKVWEHVLEAEGLDLILSIACTLHASLSTKLEMAPV